MRLLITSFNLSRRQYSTSRQQFHREFTSHELRQEIRDWLHESERLDNDAYEATARPSRKTKDKTQIRVRKMSKQMVDKAQIEIEANTMPCPPDRDVSDVPVYSWRTEKNKWATKIIYCNAHRSPNTMHKVLAQMRDLPTIAIATNPAKDTWFCASNAFILSCPVDHELCSQITAELLRNQQILKVGFERLPTELCPPAGHEPAPYLSLLNLADVVSEQRTFRKYSLEALVAQYLSRSLSDGKKAATSSKDSKQGKRIVDGRRMTLSTKPQESLKHESKTSASATWHSQELILNNVHILTKLFLAMDTKRLYLKDIPELPISGVISK